VIRQRLQPVYTKLKRHYLDSMGFDVPERYRSYFVHWGGGAEAQYIYARLLERLGPGAKVLVVGVMGGHHYYLLRNLGFDVTALDIGPQPDVPDIVYANVEEPLPFLDQTFDAVLIGEVLEHLERDVEALRNVRRVLKDDGQIVVTVPFYNDWEGGHMRIHSPVSAERLLALGGFAVQDYLERPALFRPNVFNPFQHGLSLVSYLLRGRTSYAGSNRLIGSLSWRLGHALTLGRFRRLGRGYGGYYLCQKGSTLDHIATNRFLYTEAQQ
jgi:SAM-dependent methyltransferase